MFNMKKLDDFLNRLNDYAKINAEEKGIKFTEEAFRDLFNEAFEMALEQEFQRAQLIDRLNITSRNGMIIGGIATCVIGLGIFGIKKFMSRKQKLKLVEELSEELNKEEEVVEMTSEGKKKNAVDIKELARELLESYRKTI